MEQILTSERVILNQSFQSKKHAITEIAQQLAFYSDIHKRVIVELIFEREKLGSTGMGGGVAIPHARVPQLEKIMGAFCTLDTPIDYDAPDHKPVSYIFMLLVPEGAGADHLKALSLISRVLKDDDFRETLLGYHDPQELYEAMIKQAKIA